MNGDWFSWALLLSVVLLALHVTAALFALRAVRTARTPQGAVGWAVFLVVMPYLGVPAYIAFGDFRYPRTLRDRHLSETAARMQETGPERPADGLGLSVDAARTLAGFEALSEHRAVPGNRLTLMANSAQVFETLFSAIRDARTYVLIETYILRDDGLGQALQDLLLEKSVQGVRVCVLYDPVGSYGLHAQYLARMREGGIEIVNFHALHPERRFALTRVNFRNHRKIAVIDGRVAFTGGYNIGDEYIGRNPHLGPWRDTMIRLEGPVVAQLQLHFAEDWHWAAGETLPLDWSIAAGSAGADVALAPQTVEAHTPALGAEEAPARGLAPIVTAAPSPAVPPGVPLQGEVPGSPSSDPFFDPSEALAPAPVPQLERVSAIPALVLASGPSDAAETGGLMFLHAITAAKHRVWLASPYFTPDTGLMQALRLAASRGVDVRILMAGKRDHWLVWLAAFASIEAMRGSGVKIYRYSQGFMHQKVILIDDELAVVGSHNLDSRSCRLNFELSAVMAGPEFAKQVEAMLLHDFSHADVYEKPLSEAPLRLRIAAPVARLFAPIL